MAAVGTVASAVALGAGAGLAGLTVTTGILSLAGLGAVAGALFRAAGARPAAVLGLTAVVSSAATMATMSTAAGTVPDAALALLSMVFGSAAVYAGTVLATRGGMFDDVANRWFKAAVPVAYLHPIGRPLVPRDLRRLEPYSGSKPQVLVVYHHASSRSDDSEVITIALRRRRPRGLLAGIAPFVAGRDLMLPPTSITRADLELIMSHQGALRA